MSGDAWPQDRANNEYEERWMKYNATGDQVVFDMIIAGCPRDVAEEAMRVFLKDFNDHV